MSLTSALHDHFRTFGGITVTPTRRVHQCRSRRKGGPQYDSMSARQKDSAIPTAASKWTKETLELLNAKYNHRDPMTLDFNIILPDEMQSGKVQFIKNADFSYKEDG